MSWLITDYDEITLRFDDGFRLLFVPKFRIIMTVDEPYVTISWTNTEGGTGGLTRAVRTAYTNIDFGYGQPVPSSASEVVVVINQMIRSVFTGSLPSGEIPTAFISNDTSRTMNGATWAPVPGTTIMVTSTAFVPIWAILSFESEQTGGGSNTEGDIRIVINGTPGTGIHIDHGSGNNKNGSTNLKVSALPPGTYSASIEAQRTVGTKDFDITSTKFFMMACQGPQGPVGPSGGVSSVSDDGNGVVGIDNTDPANPVVVFAGVYVDGVSITGDGSVGSPLQSPGGGSGDVIGPAGATDNGIVLFDGVTGKLIKDSGVLLSSLQTSLGFTPEDVANKSTSVVTDQASNTKYPSVKAVYDWVTGLGYLLASTAASTYKTIAGSTIEVYKASDETRNSTTVVAADGALQFAVAANKTYYIRGIAFFDTAAAASFKYSFAAPTGFTYVSLRAIHTPANTPTLTAVNRRAANLTTDVSVTAGTGGGGQVSFEATLVNAGTAGTFSFNWAQNTSDAGNTTIKAGSMIEYKQVN